MKNRNKLFHESETSTKIMGFSYENEFGKRALDGDFTKSLDISLNSLDVLSDESHYLVSSYAVKNNQIFYYTRDFIKEELEAGKINQSQHDSIIQNFFSI